MNCSKCGQAIGSGNIDARVAFICGSVMGDEYIESYFFCERCQMYTVEIYHDRFSGEDSVATRGPVEREEAEEQIAIIRRCPEPDNKRCRCEAHMEYFGGALD